jgi:hypothetical protein
MTLKNKLFITVLLFQTLLTVTALAEEIDTSDIEKIRSAMPSKYIAEPKKPRKMLVFYLCSGFKHGSIPHWNKTLEIMGQKTGAFETVKCLPLNPKTSSSSTPYASTTTLKLNFPRSFEKALWISSDPAKGSWVSTPQPIAFTTGPKPLICSVVSSVDIHGLRMEPGLLSSTTPITRSWLPSKARISRLTMRYIEPYPPIILEQLSGY